MIDNKMHASWGSLLRLSLENEHVLLRPLDETDRPQLLSLVFEEEIWRYFVNRIDSEADLDRFIADAVLDTKTGKRVVFGVVAKVDGRLAGSMAYGNMAESEKRLEIGWSWLGKDYRGKNINRWSKFLLLENAFERLGCERVEFKTDILNIGARRGLKNIGAIEEGVLRSYNFMPGGRRRDAVYYSILKAEWPSVKKLLTGGA